MRLFINRLLQATLLFLLPAYMVNAAPSGYIDTGEYGKSGGVVELVSACPDSMTYLQTAFGSTPLKNFIALAVQIGCDCPVGASEYTWAIYQGLYHPGQPFQNWRVGRKYSWSGGNFTPRLLRFEASGAINASVTGRCSNQCSWSPYSTSVSQGYASATVNDSVGGQASLLAHGKAQDKWSGSLQILANSLSIPPNPGGVTLAIVAATLCGYNTTSEQAAWSTASIGQISAWQIQPIVEVNIGNVSSMGHTEYAALSAAALSTLSISAMQVTDVP